MSKFVLLLALLFTVIPDATGQRRKQKKPKVNPVEVARKMMLTGDYPKTLDYVLSALQEQQKLKRPTCDVDSLEFLADTLRTAEANIRTTQHIVFIDSIVLPKDQAIQQLQLNDEMGMICTSEKLRNYINLIINDSGETAYINALGDNAFLATPNNGIKSLARTIRTGKTWSQPEPLNIDEQEDTEQDYPFLLADGVSLYYAAKAEDGYGGWDIYVTRYDNEDKTFLKPQNIGMPFNSEANDYMYYIDESINTGYFLTDRRQPEGMVCLYTFIPNASHTTYAPDTDFITLYQAAHLQNIAATQVGQEERINEWRAQLNQNADVKEHNEYTRYIINNTTVYTHIEQFKNPEAKEIARELTQLYANQNSQEKLLDILRKQYATHPSTALRDNILQLEAEREQTIRTIKDKEVKMRAAELHAVSKI